MKHTLPQSRIETAILFPKNLRFITEGKFTEKQSKDIKILLVSVTSVFLLILIFLQGVTLWYNLNEQQTLRQERAQLQDEVTYWEGIANKYQGYSDVYYRIAAIQYKLGNYSESQKYIKKALELDPNFPQGHVLGAQVGL